MCALPAKRDQKEFSTFAILLLGLLLASIGAILGFLHLFSLEAEVFSSVAAYERSISSEDTPVASKPGEAFYMKGPQLRDRSWQVKRTQFLQGTDKSMSFSAAELNAWFAENFKPGKAPNSEDAMSLMLVPTNTPNIYIEGNEHIYVSLPADLLIFGKEIECMFFAKGQFNVGSAGMVFSIDRLNMNCASLPGLIAGNTLVNLLLSSYRDSDEYIAINEAMSQIAAVEVKGDRILLQRR